MTDRERIIQYELQLESIINVLKERLSEFGASYEMSEFEQGRQLSYFEIPDIIQTRYSMIWDVIGKEEEA